PAVTTLGMGAAEMKEIASIIKRVLANTRPATVDSGPNAGKPSKAKYDIDDAVKTAARARVADLLGAYPVYPQLDLALLRKHFG
ncbi:MAG TPA: glycine hydroxymethyltransferase, partial [Candidatus Hydrogenedentes bacterium]|nr:glycine hydroxymethyltransferase [Candidatus Hydrogenedentota bacterium]